MNLEAHYNAVVNAFQRGHVVPFLGAGANLCDRPNGKVWRFDQNEFLPSGSELSSHLARSFDCDLPDNLDLLRVAQYIDLIAGTAPLYDELRNLFARDYPPTSIHRLLAKWPARMRSKGQPIRYQLIVTTNYDDILERAFCAENEPFDLVTYIATGPDRGKFKHRPPASTPIIIHKPNEYIDVSPSRRTVILKIHGAVDRVLSERDSFVITEDHYIDYLTRTDLSGLVPVNLLRTLQRCHFLFLGYGLRDWNLRVILHRIEREQVLSWRSWAIQREIDEIDLRFWRLHSVDVIDSDLGSYVEGLKHRLWS